MFGYDGTADDTAITQHIKNIRAKLRAAGAGEVLQTIWGVGYQWQNEKLTSLRTVLLRYLLLCGGGCALILVLWWGHFMQLINIGFLLPAVASAQAWRRCPGTVASMTADTFDSLQIS